VAKFWFETPLGAALMSKLEQPKRAARQVAGFSKRMYSAARPSRFQGIQATTGSADSELSSSLATMRNRSRALIRDASYAKRAKVVVVNNVIGSGIGLQCQVKTTRGTLNAAANAALEEAFAQWSKADNCHTGGRLHFADIERQLQGQTFEAGDVFVRIHLKKFGASQVPLALEVIESERLLDDTFTPYLKTSAGNDVRMGVEADSFGRPQFYWLRTKHPGDLRYTDFTPDMVERVPAEFMIHLAVIDRWPQTRGSPWMETALRRLNDADAYSEAEIIRARGQAVRMGFIESGEEASDFADEEDDGTYSLEMEPGLVTKLRPGEKWTESSVTAPNPQLDPFMRYMLREMAAGVGVSYESLSRDYSQSNYSSSRIALLDDRDLWKTLQLWFIRNFRCRVHDLFVRQAVLAGAVPGVTVEQYALNPLNITAVRFKPRGWSWIDPTKEVEAAKEAVKAGFTTVTQVIAQYADGRDIEDILEERKQELEMMDEAGLVFETSPEVYIPPEPAAPQPPPDKAASDEPADDTTTTKEPAKKRVLAFGR
jgi:lambda family phage portal protein